MSARALLQEAVNSAVTVTVETTDGQTATGTLRPHATDPDLYTVQPLGRALPLTIHPDDLERLTHE